MVTAPVTGSGSWPAWTASVEKPMGSGIDVFEEIEAGQDSGGLPVIVHRHGRVARGQNLHGAGQVLAQRDDGERLLEQVLDPGRPVGRAVEDFLEQDPLADRAYHLPLLEHGELRDVELAD